MAVLGTPRQPSLDGSSPNLLRIKTLIERGYVPNRQAIARWQKSLGFPPGIVLGPNSVVFAEPEILAWLESRPRQHTEETAARDAALARRLARKPDEPGDEPQHVVTPTVAVKRGR